ncbi:HigA family addiction module antidote protein [Candidatus Saccharibacteria bacterium]|nr:HigA family addiction module antidote protein [Candidatus Saccharibacteria bacterium]NIV73194.1 HigA family addiction module antidote protein [Calditrichia bacterium]NIW00556.1 HigA family addiction module antidote protein [Candidatus Saccharibacteria bacterium]NIW80916.1 HigA family addiction module antidote protein [Calditrichia bacterium]
MIMLPKNRRPIHPGEILKYEFLEPLSMTQQQLADAIGVTRVRINEIILGKRAITPDTAFRLAKFFNTTPNFWIGMQIDVDMWDTLQQNKNEYEKINSAANKS